MNRPAVAALALMSILGLTACDTNHEMAANSKICADFKAANKAAGAPQAAIADPGAAPVDECVRRWAYSLAPSHDPAAAVAEATVAACTAQLAHWNQTVLNQPGADDVEASSLTTGQPTTPLAEHSAYTSDRALFYVVQARAGHCAPPPATNGVPDGIS